MMDDSGSAPAAVLWQAIEGRGRGLADHRGEIGAHTSEVSGDFFKVWTHSANLMSRGALGEPRLKPQHLKFRTAGSGRPDVATDRTRRWRPYVGTHHTRCHARNFLA